MSSKILKSSQIRELQPSLELEMLATATPPRYRFTAETRKAAVAWQSECRPALAATVGFLDTPAVPPRPLLIEEVDRGWFVRRKVLISTGPHAKLPVYLLLPKKPKGRLPVVLAYAGHGYGVKDIVGLWEDGEERLTPDGYHKDFAIEICRRGFAVVAPEISCFGEHQTDYSYLNHALGEPVPSTCHNASTYAFMLGKSVIGMRVRDAMRLVDWLGTLPELDIARLGAMGISGGGMMTFFHAALDERVRAAVVSGYYSSFKDSILAMNHCTCNFVPGLLGIGEMQDLVGLILPRPIFIEAATRDPIFPIKVVRSSVARAREICRILGGKPAKDVMLDEFEGRHQISGAKSYDWLKQRV